MAMHPFFSPAVFGIETAYTLLVFVFCFIIYHKTKDIYDLTKHKGIMYFRDAFLFFGLAFITRFIFEILLFSNIAFGIFIRMRVLHLFFLLFTSYLSTIAIFYLLYSVIWKRISDRYFIIMSNFLAISLSILAFIFRSSELMAVFELGLLIIAVFLCFFMPEKNKRLSGNKALYFIVLIFWLFNIFIITARRPVPFEIKTMLYAISLVTFFIIYKKVARWVK